MALAQIKLKWIYRYIMFKNALMYSLTYVCSGKSAQERKLLYNNYKITFIKKPTTTFMEVQLYIVRLSC